MLALALASGCGGASEPPPPEGASASTSGAEAERGPSLAEVLRMAHRSEANRARDRYRHPEETLAFFGVRPDMTVLELAPGGGWYTEILAPYLRGRGRLVEAIPAADSESEYQRNSGNAFRAQLEERAALYGPVETVLLDPTRGVQLGESGSIDAVLTFRNLHNWYTAGRLEEVLREVFRVLKPGGVFGVVEHRAGEGASAEAGRESGYLPEAWVIEQIQGAGFTLEARSEINANPADTHEHPNGVWSLPPALRGGDVDRDAFLAIGESDRMTLRFRKPD